MKFEYLSPNQIKTINHTLENKDFVKLVNYNDNPLSQPDLTNPQSLINVKIFPYSYASVLTSETTRVDIYFPDININGRLVEKNLVYWDMLTHRNLVIYKDAIGNPEMRLLQIAAKITQQFDNVSFDTVGKINFKKLVSIPVGNDCQMYRLIGEMTNFGKV